MTSHSSTHLLFVTIAGVTACSDPAGKTPDAPIAIDAAIDVAIDAPPVCATPTGAGTMHASISAPETWTAAASPHIIPFDINIAATLTIEPCAVVRIAVGKTVTVQTNGALIAAGAPGLPVTIDSVVSGMAFSQIRALGGAISLTHTILRGGGDPLNTLVAYAGAIRLQSGTLHVDDLEIADSKSQGIYINDATNGFDATSQNLRIHGSAGFPVHTYANVIGSVPSGDYTGNVRDAIGIAGSGGGVVTSQTLHNRGVPYHVGSGMDGGRMDVNSLVAGTVAVLTIEPGVHMQFPPGGTLNIGFGAGPATATGAMIAIGGTLANRIVFTSDQGATSAAGDWFGIGFGGTVDGQTVMQHTVVEFAGGSQITGSNSCPYPTRVGTNYAAIRIYGPALTQFITDTEIPNSGRDGIDRGWRADIQPDFLATNTITTVSGCKETTPALANNGCPANPPCP